MMRDLRVREHALLDDAPQAPGVQRSKGEIVKYGPLSSPLSKEWCSTRSVIAAISSKAMVTPFISMPLERLGWTWMDIARMVSSRIHVVAMLLRPQGGPA